jgi:hypothetical protein
LLSSVGPVSAQPIVPEHSLRGQLTHLGDRVNLVVGAAIGVDALNQVFGPQLRAQIATLATLTSLEVAAAPLGSASGGFTYIFNPSLGTFTRSSDSFGPEFGSRSATGGKGRFSWGINWLHATYDTLAGLDLTNGDLHVAQHGAGPITQSSLTLRLASDTYVGFAVYGLTDDLDVSVSVPWVRVSMAADIALFGPDGADITPGGHLLTLPSSAAVGVGDIAVSAKYRAWRQGRRSIAVEVRNRMPTGDVNALRGTGVNRTSVSGVWSTDGPRLAPHANVGYEFWSREVVVSELANIGARHQLNYGFGIEIKAHPQGTLNLEIIGRRLLGGGRPAYRTVSVAGGTVELLAASSEGIDVVSCAPGVKWNIAGTVLVSANILAPLTNRGLRASVTPVLGLAWGF